MNGFLLLLKINKTASYLEKMGVDQNSMVLQSIFCSLTHLNFLIIRIWGVI